MGCFLDLCGREGPAHSGQRHTTPHVLLDFTRKQAEQTTGSSQSAATLRGSASVHATRFLLEFLTLFLTVISRDWDVQVKETLSPRVVFGQCLIT